MSLAERLRGLRLESDGRVKIIGLVARTELNNCYGVVSQIDDAKGRFIVELEDGGGNAALKPRNVVAAPKVISDTYQQGLNIGRQNIQNNLRVYSKHSRGDKVEMHSLKDHSFNGIKGTIVSDGPVGKGADDCGPNAWKEWRFGVSFVDPSGQKVVKKIKARNLGLIEMSQAKKEEFVCDSSMQAVTLNPSFGKAPLTQGSLEEYKWRTLKGNDTFSKGETPSQADGAAYFDLEARIVKYSDKQTNYEYDSHIFTAAAAKRKFTAPMWYLGNLSIPPQRLYGTSDLQEQGVKARMGIAKVEAKLLAASDAAWTAGHFEAALEAPANLALGHASKAVGDGRAHSVHSCHLKSCNSDNALNRCSRCQSVLYCSEKCQQADWKRHKKDCFSAKDLGGDFSGCSRRAMTLQSEEDFEGAIKEYRKALAIDSRQGGIRANYGCCLRMVGDLKGSLHHLERACKTPGFETSSKNLVMYGNSLKLAGPAHQKAALDAYEKAALHATDSGDKSRALTNAAVILRNRRDLFGGVRVLQEASALDPKNITAAYNLGNALADVMQIAGAIEAYRRAAELDPHGSTGKMSLEFAESYEEKQRAKVDAVRRSRPSN